MSVSGTIHLGCQQSFSIFDPLPLQQNAPSPSELRHCHVANFVPPIYMLYVMINDLLRSSEVSYNSKSQNFPSTTLVPAPAQYGESHANTK